MSNLIVSRIRQAFREQKRPMTLTDIREVIPDMQRTQISMAMCYLMRQKYVIREKVPTSINAGRKEVWQYTYNDERYVERKYASHKTPGRLVVGEHSRAVPNEG